MDRERRKKSSSVSDAIARLRADREGGTGARARTFEVREESAVYDVVDEKDYSKLVEKRRQEGGDFVVDDDGLGYMDVGDDDWFGSEEILVGNKPEATAGKKLGQAKRRHKGGDEDGRRSKIQAVEAPNPKAKQRMQQMFMNAPAKPVRASKPSDESSDALLESILAGINEPSAPIKTPPRRPQQQKSSRGQSKKPPARRPGRTSLSLTGLSLDSPQPAAPENPALDAPEAPQDDFTFDVPSGAGEEEDCADGLMALANLVDEEYQLDENPKGDLSDPNPGTLDSKETAPFHGSELLESGPPSPTSIPEVGSNPFSEIPTKKPSFVAPAPKSYGPASGWQEIHDMGVQEEASDEKPWVDDGTLPVDEAGNLPFFVLDALEDSYKPGVVYLFGKIPCKDSEQYVSCCAVVRNIEKVLFVVPKEGIFADSDGEIAELESAASKDPGNRGRLMRHLQTVADPVKHEVRELLLKHRIQKFRMKPVKRNYAFEETGVRHGEGYVVKVYCPASEATLPLGAKGENFVSIFGTNQNLLELLLLKRGIMGPCWIGLKKPVKKPSEHQRSWCSVEVEVSGHKSITQELEPEWKAKAPPPLKVAAINLKTFVNPATQVNEVVVASVIHLDKIKCDGPTPKEQWNRQIRHFSATAKLRGQPWPAGFENAVRKQNESPVGKRNGGNVLKTMPSERALLSYFLARLKSIDPDVLVGHNIAAFDLTVLLHRMQHNKVDQWSRLGRLKRQKYPSFSGGGQVFGGGAGPGVLSVLAGRLLCDTYIAARELVREVNYTLTTLAGNLLGEKRNDVSVADIPRMFDSVQGLSQLISHAESDAWLSMGLMFQLSVLPLTKQLTNLSGSLWNKTLQGQRAQRIEMLLLHEFHGRKYLLPDKLSAKEKLAKAKSEGLDVEDLETAKKSKKKAQYAGGLVLEPKKGLYDKIVLLLDFNSLYPSIIQEYNICFTTVTRPDDESAMAELPVAGGPLAPLPTVIRNLVQRRRQAKKLMAGTKDVVHRQQLNVRQQALKLTANSMYGCLGFSNSRFFCKPLAELITSQGREILQSTVDLVQGKLGLEVVYGDTDSIMINTGKENISEVMQLGMAIKKEVNKHYKLLEIDIDGVFKSLLLLKKKKYAALKVEVLENGAVKEEMEQKGLDIVRRDWCPLSKSVGTFALKEILSGKPKEDVVMSIHDHLREVKDRVMDGQLELGEFIITKQLTKAPKDYPDAKSQPHVQVAIRRKAQGKRDGVMPGETVPYVICMNKDEESSDTKGLALRAFHPEEVIADEKEIDKHYYLAHQVHPSVSRLCAPIEGTDEARLADCLGLDPSKFRHKVSTANDDALVSSGGFLDDDERFKGCEPLTLVAPNGINFSFRGVNEILKGTVSYDDALTPPDSIGDAAQRISPAALANKAALEARKCVSKYYDGWMRMDDDPEGAQTRDPCLKGFGDVVDKSGHAGIKSTLSQVFDEKQAYLQLSHLHRLLDAPGAITRVEKSKQDEAVRRLGHSNAHFVFGKAADSVSVYRDRCQFRWVSLSSIFGQFGRNQGSTAAKSVALG
ncbi:hypothetical protein BSKO_10210 [Bryopsis sp. KO-2023]|nr:hypothetical protein BSKO_10210 [Bryopsis sp. KO-2023]